MDVMSLRQRAGKAVWAAGFGLALIASETPACAQPSTFYPGMSSQPPFRMPGGGRYGRGRAWSEEMLEQDDYTDVEEAGGREDRKTPKTDLGKAIVRQDIRREAQSVLSARAKLAAKRRDAAMNPETPETETKPAGADGGAGEGPAVEPAGEAEIGGMEEAMPLPDGMPPEVLAELMEQMREAGLEGGEFEIGIGGPDGEMMEEGFDPESGEIPGTTGGPGGGAGGMTPEQVKKRREQQEKVRKQAEHFKLLVVAGDWAAVGTFLKDEAGEDGGLIYEWMLGSLRYGDSALVPDEVLEISEAAPTELNDKIISSLGGLLMATQQRGCQAGAVAARIAQGTEHFGGEDPVKRKRAAGLLVAAGLPIQAQAYLAPLETARRDRDVELLNLYAIYFNALAKERTGEARDEAIEEGWNVCIDAMAIESAPARERSKSLARALGFLDDVPAETGDTWLRTLFAAESDVGWETIERVNRQCRTLREYGAPVDRRMKGLDRARRLGRAILVAETPVIAAWRTGLNMLTLTVLEEAEYTRTMAERSASMYGYGGYGQDDGQTPAIPAETLGKALPDAQWLAAIDPGLSAKLELMAATTAGGAGDVQSVVDMIRPIVNSDTERARKLAEALLQAWPNYVGRSGASVDEDPYGMMGYGGMYGGWRYGGMGGSGIPLTRAKQARNLAKLREALDQLREVGIDPIPTDPLVAAFAASYSPAEVFSREDIERVFGPTAAMPAELRLKIAERMRTQLAGAWRSPRVQEQAGTRRTSQELAKEVVRGYELATELAEEGAESWERRTLIGDLFYDQAEFAFGQNADMAMYESLRSLAFDHYRDAAGLYRAELAAERTKPSARVYSQWFSAAMGASDLGYLTRQDRPDLDQVKAVMDALGELAEPAPARHVGLFAQEIVRSMQRMSPELKPNFLRQAMRIIGEHPEGRDARSRLALYDDLNKEVELTLELAGPTSVGVEPFGVNVFISSSRAVAREGGGFGKYLMNDQWSPSGGELHYRDEFEKQVREKWSGDAGAGFEIMAVSFHKPAIQRLGDPREGWERTPLCFVLLKAKDASVERVPPLKLDMDFSDGQGMVILPVGSNELTVSAADLANPGSKAPELTDLQVEQILDDRESESSGVVRVEIRATAKGIVPPLAELMGIPNEKGTEFGGELVTKTAEDHGLSVSDLQTETGQVVPLTERSWTITLAAAEGSGTSADFAFPMLLGHAGKVVNKRYTDADLAEAPKQLAIALPGGGGTPWWAWLLGLGVLGGAGTAAYVASKRAKQHHPEDDGLWAVPDQLSPIGAIGMLRRVEALNGTVLSPGEQRELSEQIADLERAYFAPGTDQAPANGQSGANLRQTVLKWTAKARK